MVWFAQFTDNEATFDDYYVPGLFANYFTLAKDGSSLGRERLAHWLYKKHFQRLISTLHLGD